MSIFIYPTSTFFYVIYPTANTFHSYNMCMVLYRFNVFGVTSFHNQRSYHTASYYSHNVCKDYYRFNVLCVVRNFTIDVVDSVGPGECGEFASPRIISFIIPYFVIAAFHTFKNLVTFNVVVYIRSNFIFHSR